MFIFSWQTDNYHKAQANGSSNLIVNLNAIGIRKKIYFSFLFKLAFIAHSRIYSTQKVFKLVTYVTGWQKHEKHKYFCW